MAESETRVPEADIVDFAVLTPLPEEWVAAKRRLDNPIDVPGNYPTVQGTLGSYSVVICYPGDPANSVSADFTRYVANRWQPRWIVLLGVAGGFPELGVRVGDVVVASRIYGYDYGKISEGIFTRRDRFDQPTDVAWLAHLRVIEAEGDDSSSHWSRHVGVRRPDKSRTPSRLFIGPVASGDKVIDDPSHEFYAQAKVSLPDIYAIEMEGTGAATVVNRLQAEGMAVSFFMIRGISDTPRQSGEPTDGPRGREERDSWKPYAAAAAAALFEQLLRRPGAPLPRKGSNGPRTSAPQGIDQPSPAMAASNILHRQSSLSTTALTIEALRIAQSVQHEAKIWLAEELKEHAYKGREDLLPPYRKIRSYASRISRPALIQYWGNLEQALIRSPEYFLETELIYPDSISEAERTIGELKPLAGQIVPFLTFDPKGDEDKQNDGLPFVGYIRMGEVERLVNRMRQRVIDFLMDVSQTGESVR